MHISTPTQDRQPRTNSTTQNLWSIFMARLKAGGAVVLNYRGVIESKTKYLLVEVISATLD